MTGSATREPTVQPITLRARCLSVRSVEDLSAVMRRITFWPDPAQEALRLHPLAVGDHVKMIVPDPGSGRVELPLIRGDRPQWSGGERPLLRDYTLGLGTDRDGVVLEMLTHDIGPAGRWAAQARAGATVGILGPRGSIRQPDGYGHYLCAGDLTAWPALRRWWHEAPEGASVDLVVQVANESQILPLPSRPESRVTWLVGEARDLITEHVSALGLPDQRQRYVWAAGEASAMTVLRRHLLGDRGLPRSQVRVDGYWRRGTTGYDHHAPLDDQDEQ